jgi:hypothetical protein
LPNDWKRANITAIYEKVSSLTSHVSKILQSIIRDGILEHLNKNSLIRDTQLGFMKKRSCLTNVLEFLDTVSNYIDQGIPIDVIYLDFQKAFDKVPHKRLMLKVKALGITGLVFNCIQDWLHDSEQRA